MNVISMKKRISKILIVAIATLLFIPQVWAGHGDGGKNKIVISVNEKVEECSAIVYCHKNAQLVKPGKNGVIKFKIDADKDYCLEIFGKNMKTISTVSLPGNGSSDGKRILIVKLEN